MRYLWLVYCAYQFGCFLSLLIPSCLGQAPQQRNLCFQQGLVLPILNLKTGIRNFAGPSTDPLFINPLSLYMIHFRGDLVVHLYFSFMLFFPVWIWHLSFNNFKCHSYSFSHFGSENFSCSILSLISNIFVLTSLSLSPSNFLINILWPEFCL